MKLGCFVLLSRYIVWWERKTQELAFITHQELWLFVITFKKVIDINTTILSHFYTSNIT